MMARVVDEANCRLASVAASVPLKDGQQVKFAAAIAYPAQGIIDFAKS